MYIAQIIQLEEHMISFRYCLEGLTAWKGERSLLCLLTHSLKYFDTKCHDVQRRVNEFLSSICKLFGRKIRNLTEGVLDNDAFILLLTNCSKCRNDWKILPLKRKVYVLHLKLWQRT